MAKEFNVDCMKYRKSTHLASVDVEMIIAEKGVCELTIKVAYYEEGVDVNGKKQDGYFIEFNEPVKNMIANSGNRGKIAKIVALAKGMTAVESRNVGNWGGTKLRLAIDHARKLKGATVDGIDVVSDYKLNERVVVTKTKLDISDGNYAQIKDWLTGEGKTLAMVIAKYELTDAALADLKTIKAE